MGRVLYALFVKNNNTKIVQVLIDAKANINQEEQDGQTPVFIAARFGGKDIVTALINANANVDMKTKFGDTARSIAAQEGYSEIVQILLASKNQNM
eukprot:TRINITY_DN5321_c0_g1_i1.p1 TRINITY_DN5321_c0_g1~~TRINITY_DN5321_c0_g1_i1.p1  ORF type:complete len:96 (+),score=16.66 TRINITY_DN5321_c0_g1_i1:187-474(+)